MVRTRLSPAESQAKSVARAALSRSNIFQLHAIVRTQLGGPPTGRRVQGAHLALAATARKPCDPEGGAPGGTELCTRNCPSRKGPRAGGCK